MEGRNHPTSYVLKSIEVRHVFLAALTTPSSSGHEKELCSCRTNVMVADYAYYVPRSVCLDGVLEPCVATCTVECVRKVRNTTLNQTIGFK